MKSTMRHNLADGKRDRRRPLRSVEELALLCLAHVPRSSVSIFDLFMDLKWYLNKILRTKMDEPFFYAASLMFRSQACQLNPNSRKALRQKMSSMSSWDSPAIWAACFMDRICS